MRPRRTRRARSPAAARPETWKSASTSGPAAAAAAKRPKRGTRANSGRPRSYRAVIFDVDGTLVDSNNAHAWAWIQALAEGGRRVDFGRVRPLIGKGGDKLLNHYDVSPFKRPLPVRSA